MKKSMLLSFMLILSSLVFAEEPVKSINDYEVKDTEEGATLQEENNVYINVNEETFYNLNYWSMTLEAGLDRFDGDIRQEYNSLIPNSINKITLGASIEYTVSSAWSLGLDYYYLPLRAKDTRKNGYVVADYKAQMHNVSLFTSFNLVKGFLPFSTTKWGVWANVGLGYAWYKSTYLTDRAGTKVMSGHKTPYTDFNDTINDGRAMFVPVGVLIEYNFDRYLALGVKAQLRAFNKDYIEQRIQLGVTNDFLEMATLQLRIKFAGNDDQHFHTRNTVIDYQSQIDELQEQLNNIVIPPAGPNYDDRLDDLEQRVKRMEDILCPDGPDGDMDGVPDCRDQEPETPAGNQVDFWGRTIACSQIEEEDFIYFDFDKTGLDNEAHRAIAICARKMNNDPELIVEVRGFTDNMGNDNYNYDLSQRRADRVKHELVKIYGIGEQRIIANGKGKYNPNDKTIPFRPYRTCVLFYNKK